jgi:signal transduction histidine kinase/DNA-binding response OmpR family regulator
MPFLFLLHSLGMAHAQYSAQDSVAIREKIRKGYDYAFNGPDTGLIIGREIIEESKAIAYPYGEAHAYLFLADCYISKGDYARAINNLLTARAICAENNITSLNQRINRPFGELYIELGEPEKAIAHQRLAMQQSTEEQETVIVTHGLAKAYYEAGKPDSALLFAEPLYEAVGKLWAAPVVTLGNIYASLGKYDEALSVFRTRSGLTYDIDVVGNYIGRAKVFQAIGRVDSTRFYASMALQSAREKQFYKFINEAAEILAVTFETGDREKYLEYLLISYAARDSLYSREKMNQINNYIFADETRRRELTAAELQFATQKRIFLLIALSVILLAVGLLLWRNNRLKTRSNALLRQEKQKVESTLEQLKATQSQLIAAEKTARQLERQEAERLRELDDLKTRLYTNITHEFRTPLTVIMGINDNIQGHEQERNLIKRNAENLLRLISQLLDLSKLDSGDMRLNVSQGDVIGYLHYLAESFYSMASDKRVDLQFRPEESSLIMDFDEEKVQHIIYNLMSNAIKFTRPGGKVALETSSFESDGQECLKITVKDTGAGIPEKDLPNIFNRFYQSKEATGIMNSGVNLFGGTGIGLALTKELVELMGGDISVKSKVGWGTEFTVLLPARKEETTPRMETDFEPGQFERTIMQPFEYLPAKPDQIPSDKPQLILVEDNEGVVAYIRSILQEAYHIQVAVNGQEGIDMALEHIPDLVITDVMMPEKNGYEVCKTLKKDERTSHIPIVMLTAKADFSSKIEGLETGADAYLSKPFEKEELLVRLRKLLELRKALQEHYGAAGYLQNNQNNTVPTIEDRFLNRLCTAIEERLEDADLSIPELCRTVLLSHTQLYRKLKAVTGKTPSQFIRSIRLRKAMELLQTSGLNISEIAYKVGFNDPNYFSRVFKKEYGKAPGEMEGSGLDIGF